MSIDKDVFYIGLAILTAIVSSAAAFINGRRQSQRTDDDCEYIRIEYTAFEKHISSLMFGPHVSKDDIALVLYNLTGMSVDDVTLSNAKTTQALEAIQEFKRRGVLLQVLPALYKQCPHLIGLKKVDE